MWLNNDWRTTLQAVRGMLHCFRWFIPATVSSQNHEVQTGAAIDGVSGG